MGFEQVIIFGIILPFWCGLQYAILLGKARKVEIP
jgi:hypothetical protein